MPKLTPYQLDAATQIARASSLARRRGKTCYVSYGLHGLSWEIFEEQPPASQSHWAAHADGSLFAHTDTDSADYFYEEV